MNAYRNFKNEALMLIEGHLNVISGNKKLDVNAINQVYLMGDE